MKLVVFLFGLSLLSACADVTKVNEITSQSFKLNKMAAAQIALPSNGSYGDKAYPSSGAMTQAAILNAMSKHMVKVETLKAVQDMTSALDSAKSKKVDYLVYPEILHWEDRSTEWSGKSDLVTIKIQILDVKSGETISAATIDGKSGLWTFGGDHPQDLLPTPIQEYFSKLF